MSVDPASGSAPSMLSATSSILTNGSFPPKRQTPPTPDLQKWILDAAKVGGAKTLTHNLTNEFDMIANRSTECVSVSVVVRACMHAGNCVCLCVRTCMQGRPTDVVRLTRPLTGGLGFSVVGLNPTGSSSRGVFIKHVQPGGIAHRFSDTCLVCSYQ